MATDDTSAADLAWRLRHARQVAGLTQAELAVAAGLTQPTVSRWERGVGAGPGLTEALAIARVTNASLTWLACGWGDPPAFEAA